MLEAVTLNTSSIQIYSKIDFNNIYNNSNETINELNAHNTPASKTIINVNHNQWLDAFYYIFHPTLVILSWLLMITVVLGNLVVVTAIWREKQLHSVTNFLVASLAIADFLIGLIVMPFSIMSEIMTDEWAFGSTWCDLWHSFDVLGSTASIFNLVTISYDRYLAITNPISYTAKMTHKRVTIIIIFLWIVAASISFPAIVWWRLTATVEQLNTTNKCFFTSDKIYLLSSSIVSFYGPLLIMLYAYYRIYKEAIRQTRFLNFGSKTIKVNNNKNNWYFWRWRQNKSLRMHSAESKGQTNVVLRAHRGGGAGCVGGGGGSSTSESIGKNRSSGNLSNQSSLNIGLVAQPKERVFCGERIESLPPAVKPPPSLLPLMIMNSDTSNESTSCQPLASNNSNSSDSSIATKQIECPNSSIKKNGRQLLCTSTSIEVASFQTEKNRHHNLSSWKMDNRSSESYCNNTKQVHSKQRTKSECHTSRFFLESLRRKYSKHRLSKAGCLISVTIDDADETGRRLKSEFVTLKRKDCASNSTCEIPSLVNMIDTESFEFIDSTTVTEKSNFHLEDNNIQCRETLNKPKRDINKDDLSITANNDDIKVNKIAHQQSQPESTTNQTGIKSSWKKMSGLSNNNGNNHESASSQSSARNRSVGKKLSKLAKERKAAKTLGIVVGAFMLCWLPFFIANIVRAFCVDCIYKPEVVILFVNWLGWFNSALNPFIYACWSREFRRAFRKVIKSWYLFFVKPCKTFRYRLGFKTNQNNGFNDSSSSNKRGLKNSNI